MDKKDVASLIAKYLDSIKLLVRDVWPNDIPEILDDLIEDTAKISKEMKRQRKKWQSERKSLTNTHDRKLNLKNYIPPATPTHRKQLDPPKELKSQQSSKRMKIFVESQQKASKPSTVNTKLFKSTSKDDKAVDKKNNNAICLNDGCVFQ